MQQRIQRGIARHRQGLHRLGRVACKFGLDKRMDTGPTWAGGGFARAHLHLQQCIDLIDQRRVVQGVQRVLGQLGKAHGWHAGLRAYPACSQQRAQHVEVLLVAHLIGLQMLTKVLLGHGGVVVPALGVGEHLRRQRAELRHGVRLFAVHDG
ncbi:hypothetical protein D3C72_1861830 [compost metagenome]